MKTRLLAARLALLAIIPSVSSFATESSSPYPPVPFGSLRIEKGMSRAQVREMFGDPIVLSPIVWAFFNLKFTTSPSAVRCDAMVLRFDGDRVGDIRLCESGPVRALMAQLERNKAGAVKVSAK
jgi:hypothetical protein